MAFIRIKKWVTLHFSVRISGDFRIFLKVYQISTPKIPLKAYAYPDFFKVYLLDVGLLSAMTNLSAKTILHGSDIFQEFRGALVENYVAEELVHSQEALP